MFRDALQSINESSFRFFQEMELLVLSKLKWDVSAVTPHDFLDQIISRLSLHKDRPEAIKTHAQTFIALCATGKELEVASVTLSNTLSITWRAGLS